MTTAMVTVKMARKRESAVVPKIKKTEPLTIREREGGRERKERERRAMTTTVVNTK